MRSESRKSQIVIDARWLVGGVGTYTRHVLEGLSKNGNGFELHAITQEQHAAEVKQWCARVTVVNAPIYTLREQWAIPRAVKECGLLHVPHYNAPLLHRGPLVITIHDLIHITDPVYRRSFKGWGYARLVLNLAARKADHIITVSEYSKAQIVERLGVSVVEGEHDLQRRKCRILADGSGTGLQGNFRGTGRSRMLPPLCRGPKAL